MLGFENKIDIGISFSEAASVDAAFVISVLGAKFCVYNYKNWLDEQAGQPIASFSRNIYTNIPCIILATRDWFVRPATVLEMKFLASNDCEKLVFDYAGEFRLRERDHAIRHVRFGTFEGDVVLSRSSIKSFAQSLFGHGAK